MLQACKFSQCSGKKLLEIGSGLGTDSVQFARSGAHVTCLDLTPESIALAKKHFEIRGLEGDFVVGDAENLPFPDNTFDVIYASHILEHTPWYKIEETLREWVRVLKINGEIEIWVPDGLKIAQAFCDAEMAKNEDYKQDGWYKFNNEKDPNKWFSGRMFSYGDGLGTRGHFNFHLSSFSERYLTKIMLNAGLKDVVRLSDKDCRGCSHGWINLGIKGTKK
jgi:ubiquinone/menaquinone biosynthesis C-methylase UbiE